MQAHGCSRSKIFTYIILLDMTNKLIESLETVYHIYLIYTYSYRQAYANSVDPDQTPQNVVSDLGLHCLRLPQQFVESSAPWE